MFKSLFAFALFSSLTGAVSAQYTVATVAGDSAGYIDGANSVALFSSPTGIAADTAGNLYIADTYNNVIRKIWLKKDSVSTFVGNGTAGFKDTIAAFAMFNSPIGVCVDKHNNVYVADMNNNRIRKITPSGTVSTYGGNGKPGFKNGAGDSAEFYLPTGVAVDTLGNVYVLDDGNNSVRKISTSDTVTTLAGTGAAGFYNGPADSARFYGLFGIAVNDSGTIYLSEYGNNDIRRIKNGIVSVFAGFATQATSAGIKDGLTDSALFNSPMGLVIDSLGGLIICDEFNYRIRKISHDTISEFAGNGTPSFKDTVVYLAGFNRTYGITRIRATFYLTDNYNNRVRKMVPPPPLGIASVVSSGADMLVYPNPCNDRLVIASAPAGQAEILDVTGREVWNAPHLKAPSIISTSGLSPGIYFLRMIGEQGSATSKIVIQR